jgi:protein-disulfide isomerase
MKNQPVKPKSGAPMIIIGAAALIIIFVVVYYLQTSKPGSNSGGPKASPTVAKTQGTPSNAPLGAQPPNMLGSATAAVTVEEFADYQCPTCAAMHPVMKNIQSEYGSRIKFIYRSFPLTQIHKNAYDAAVAAEAASLQDRNKFWEMQNLLFTNQKIWSDMQDPRPTFKEYAGKIGLDVVRWENDMLGLPAKNRVDADLARSKALNIQSTPTIYINGQALSKEQLNPEAIRQLIDAELQKAPAQTAAPAPASPANTANGNK